jgi:dipeptidyl aminopeptidase/acylaminoacyl peptidase
LLVWLSMARAGYESDRNRPTVLHRESGQIHSPVLDHVDQSFDAVVFAPPLAGPNAPSTLYMTTTRNGRHMIFHMQLDKTGGLLQEPLPLITQHFNSNVLVLGRDRLLFTRDSFFAPAELFVCKIDGTQERRVTNFNTAALTAMRMGDCTDAYFRGALDEPVHAWLFRPIDFDPRRKYPLAVIVHGGPQGAIEDHWHYRWNPQIYAAQGFAVLCINFHGSTGFGQAFCDSIRGEWGTLPYEDIMKGVAYFCKNYSWIDESRAGALGASYGGWMMNWLNGHTDKFRCLVNHCGIFSQTAMHCSTEELYFTEWEMQGCSWDPAAVANYQRFSPSTYVANWKTPTMVVHGGRDYRVPDVEGLQTFSALQRLGVPSELLYFPDECHWVLGAQNSVTWHEHVLAWLHRWLDEAKEEKE